MTAENLPMSYEGLPIILLSYDGKPELVVQLTEVFETNFSDIDSKVTSIDGPPVRDPDVWIPLHRNYWNGVLKDYGRSCTDDMPVLVEKFKLVFSSWLLNDGFSTKYCEYRPPKVLLKP